MVTDELEKYFKDIPEDRINQYNSEYDETKPCSIWSHVAYALRAGKTNAEGIDAFIKSLGINAVECLYALQKACAGDDPFGQDIWLDDPEDVFASLDLEAAMEDFADLEKLVLDGATLSGLNLNGMELEYASLRNVNMRWTSAKGCVFKDVDFNGAILMYSNLMGSVFEGVSFRNATLEHSVLMKAVFHMTDFRNANLRHTDILCSEIKHCRLNKAVFDRRQLAEHTATLSNILNAEVRYI